MDDTLKDIEYRMCKFREDMATESYSTICSLRWRKQLDKAKAKHEFIRLIRLDKWKRRHKSLLNKVLQDYGHGLDSFRWVLESYCAINWDKEIEMQFIELWQLCGSKPKWLS